MGSSLLPSQQSFAADVMSAIQAVTDDVLAALPALPSAEHSRQANRATPSLSLDYQPPQIKLYISESNVPAGILEGLRLLVDQAPRRNIVLDTGAEHFKRAWGSDKQGTSCWWFNVIFEEFEGISAKGADARPLNVVASSDRFSSEPTRPFVVKVVYSRSCEAYRGLGHILGCTRYSLLQNGQKSEDWSFDEETIMAKLPLTQTANFATLGTMIDCSRNGVLLVDSVKFLLRRLALMGYNMIQLYTEDTYKIEGEPFFGYLRGGYTATELTEIDDYAYSLGIEVIPCIQTLGHLGQMLQWPRYLHLRDTSEVLLADSPETYAMLVKMIRAATKPFRTSKIHLGMDETHGLGHGRYHTLFGQHQYKEPTRIFIDHLSKVNEICLSLDLQPCIWSDMLFCLNARNNSLLGYYDSAQPTTAVEGIPDNLELVYWDYYHTSQQSYTNRIESHWKLGRKSPWMAAGSWTWSRFWTALPFTFATCKASMNASKAKSSGVESVFLTIWGDEGNEVDLLSSLPAWSYYAEHGYEKGTEVDLIRLKASFDGICAANFDDYVMASRLDDVNPEEQTIDDGIHFAPNTSKWLLWEEPVLGFVSPSMHASGIDLEHHFYALASYLSSRLRTASDSTTPARSLSEFPHNARLRLPSLLAKVLSLKSGLRLRLHTAYAAQDWAELGKLAGQQETSRLSQLRRTLKQLINYHRQMWMSIYKPFGWEVLELRYGGLASRLETLHLRVIGLLRHIRSGGRVGLSIKSPCSVEEGVMLNAACASEEDYEEEVTHIPELAEPLHVVYGSAEQLLDYHRVSRVTYC